MTIIKWKFKETTISSRIPSQGRWNSHFRLDTFSSTPPVKYLIYKWDNNPLPTVYYGCFHVTALKPHTSKP